MDGKGLIGLAELDAKRTELGDIDPRAWCAERGFDADGIREFAIGEVLGSHSLHDGTPQAAAAAIIGGLILGFELAKQKPLASLGLLSELGTMWRNDWSDFDGRTLRTQLDTLETIIAAEARGEDVTDRIETYRTTWLREED